MCRSAVVQVEINFLRNAFYITITTIEKEVTFSMCQILLQLKLERRKILGHYTQYLSIVKSLISVDARCSWSSWVKLSILQIAKVCVITVELACKLPIKTLQLSRFRLQNLLNKSFKISQTLL